MELAQGNNLPRIKVSNQAAIRRMVYQYGPITRGTLSSRLALTMPTITTNINSMIAGDIIREVGVAEEERSSAGRRVKLLDIVPEARYFLGAELRGISRSVCVTDYRGHVTYSRNDDNPIPNYDEAIRACCRDIREALAGCGIPRERIMGIGVGVPGLVDSDRGVLIKHPGHNWTDKDIAGDVRELTGFQGPIQVENNACARAFAAQLFQRKMLNEVTSFAYMFVSTGIACPLIYNFIPDRGVLVGLGEVGHVVLDPNGPPCACGNHGCLETFASDKTVIARCEEAMRMGEAPILWRLCGGRTPTMDQIVRAQEQGETGIARIVDTAVAFIGTALNNIESFARPQVVLVEGKLFTLEANRRRLLEVVRRNPYAKTPLHTRLQFITPDPLSGALGGAAAAIRNDLETYIE